ncbi:Protein of unknown function (DUF2392) domain containing protein [Elaphomyces granulatus]
MSEKHLPDPCMDCKDRKAILTVRTRQLCSDCFVRFISIKVVRRMELYRLRDAFHDRQPKLLLPLSCGVSSTVLLHILNGQLERQAASGQGRVAYKLHVLLVDPSTISIVNPSCEERFAQAQQYFPRHTYTRVPFHAIFQYDEGIRETISRFAGSEFEDRDSMSDSERLDAFRAGIPTASSKNDIDNILLTRLIVACARSFGCEAVVWGDSDSRLAAKTLANVAKGRGSSLTWQVCDGLSPWDIQFSFPLRDLYKSELQLYTVQVPNLADIIVPEQPMQENQSNRNLSIDELMKQYIETQGEKYPGVMANVVRTVAKLQQPSIPVGQVQCTLCGSCCESPPNSTSSGSTADLPNDELTDRFCYGCSRSQPSASIIPAYRR